MINKPTTTFNIRKAPTLQGNEPQKVLMIGQQITDSSLNKKLVTNVLPDGQEISLFGRKSMLAAMIGAFRELDTVTRVDAIPYNDAVGSVAADGGLTFSGSATGSGTFKISIQSKIKHTFTIGVANGDSSISLGAQLTTAVNNDISIGVTAVDNSDGSVTLVAVNAGVEGNYITIAFEGFAPGISLSVLAFANGATDPTIAAADFDQISNIRYNTIVYPARYDKSVIATLVNDRFNVSGKVLDGVAITNQVDTFSNLLTVAAPLNSQNMVVLGGKLIDRPNHVRGDILEYSPVIASYFAAIRSLRLTTGQNIPELIVNPASGVNVQGGPQNAAVPYFNTPISTLPIINSLDLWTDVEQQQLNSAGISILGNNSTDSEIICGEIVTTYLTDSQGTPDTTFKYLNTIDTASQIREFFVTNNKTQYSQSVLTQGDVTNSSQVNVQTFNAYQASLYQVLSQEPYSLTVAGQAANEYFKDNINTTINDSTVTSYMIVPIVTQLRAIDATIEISFTL